MKEQQLILDKLLGQLEVEKAGIQHAIEEIQRQFALLDEVESWGLLVREEPRNHHGRVDSAGVNFPDQAGVQEWEEDIGLVAAGYSSSRPSWALRPLVA